MSLPGLLVARWRMHQPLLFFASILAHGVDLMVQSAVHQRIDT